MKALSTLPVGPKARRDRLVELVSRAKPREIPALVLGCETFIRNSPALAFDVVEALRARAGDPRIAALGTRLHEHPPPNVSKKLARAFERLVQHHAGKRPAPAKPVAPAIADPGPLLAEIAAHPDEDGPREVYADWLAERNDIRGELITLQLARARSKPSADARQREKELLANHKTALLGPFATCAKRTGLRFDRGFVVDAVASARWPAAPENALLERLDLEGHALALDAPLSSLRELAGYYDDLDKVLTVAPRLRAVRYLRTFEPTRLGFLMRASRAVEDITISTWGAEAARLGFAALAGSPLARGAQRLELRASWPNETTLAMLLAAVPASCTTFVLDIVSHVEMCFTCTRTPKGWSLAAEIAKTRQLPRMEQELARTLAGLPRLAAATFVAKFPAARTAVARAVAAIPNATVR